MPIFTCRELAEAAEGELQNVSGNFSVSRISTDSREDLSGALFIPIRGEKFDGHQFLKKAREKGAALLLANRDTAPELLPEKTPVLFVTDTLRAYQKIASFHRKRFPGLHVTALTGSCGKTSTKEMLRAIFREAYGEERVLATEGNTNNQIGVPQNLLRLTEIHREAVIEMGTNHFGEIAPLAEAVLPDTALIVSIGNCHLENLGSLEGVATEKSNIFRFLKPGGTAVIPADAVGKEIMIQAAGDHRKLFFGSAEGAPVSSKYLGGDLNGSRFELTEHETGKSCIVAWGLSGAHQAANAAGACAAALAAGIPFETILKGLSATTLPGQRMKKTEHHHALWINDSYNANRDSFAAGLKSLKEFADPEKLLLVMGDMLETGAQEAQVHQEILTLAVQLFPAARIAAVGPRMSAAAEALHLAGKNCLCFPDSEQCAKAVRSLIPERGIVYLKASHGIHLDRVEAFDESH